MNSYTGEITDIEQDNHLSLIKVRVGEILFTSVVISPPEASSPFVKGKSIQLLFKETEVLIGRNIPAGSISLQNKIPGTITRLDTGKLLSRVDIDTPIGEVVSVVTTHAVQELQLKEGDEVTAMVKTNEIMLEE